MGYVHVNRTSVGVSCSLMYTSNTLHKRQDLDLQKTNIFFIDISGCIISLKIFNNYEIYKNKFIMDNRYE